MKRGFIGAALTAGLLYAGLTAFSALAADKYAIDFENGKTFASAEGGKDGALTTEKKEIVGDTASWKLDSTKSEIEWNEGYWTDWTLLPLEANATYTLSLDYKILQEDNDGEYYYMLVRAKSGGYGENDRGWTQWTQDDGLTGHKEITFDLADFTDYYLDIGIHSKGAMSIDNIVIAKN